MKFDVLTLFPEMFNCMQESILGRAQKTGKIEIEITNIRDFSKDKHKKVDDTPYGGGAGMIMRPDVVFDAYNYVLNREESESFGTENKDNSETELRTNLKTMVEENSKAKEKPKVIYLTPQGTKLNQSKVESLAKEQHLILLCGHYEGIDQRVLDTIVDEEISIGDYVLTGGEIPAMVLIDSVSRYVEGVLKEHSTEEESFSQGLLEYPQYTRPEVFMGQKVPEVLISGHHENIDKWRKEQSLRITYKKRPDLFLEYEKVNSVKFSEDEKKILEKIKNEVPSK